MYSFRISSLVEANSITGSNQLSLGTEGTLLTLTERVAFSNLVDTKDTQTKKKTSKILQKALILIDLKRYHMEGKKKKGEGI